MAEEMKKVSFWLPASHEEKLNEIALKRGVKVSEIYREAAEEYIKYNTLSDESRLVPLIIPLGLYFQIKEVFGLKLYRDEGEMLRSILKEGISKELEALERQDQRLEKQKQKLAEAEKRHRMTEVLNSE